MSIMNFIRLNRLVTAEQAGLVAAGILPAEVNSSIFTAKNGNYTGWQTAVTIRDALLNNVVAYLTPAPALITYWDSFGDGYAEYRDIADITDAIFERGTPNAVSFEASTLWPWIANHVDIDPELHACIQKYCDAQKSANETTANSTQENKPADDTQSVEQVTALAEKVAELTERLQQAEAEIAALKGRAPTFRHMTPLLELVAEVQERYWGDNWDQSDPDTNTRQDDIVEWIKADPRCGKNNKGEPSEKRAEMVAIVAKPITRSPSNSPPEP